METPMNSWNDDRLDELNRRVENGFASMDQRFIRLEGEMKDGFAKVDKRFEQVDKRFEQVASREELGEVKVQLNRLNDRFDRLLFILIAACVGLIGTLLVAAFGFVVQS